MSSLIVLHNKDNIIFASDTAVSMTNDTTSYRVGNMSKLTELEDCIMFCSGKMWLRDKLISKINKKSKLNEIQEILKYEILPYCTEFDLEVAIALKDLSEIIFMSSYDSFNYKVSIPTDDINLFSMGKDNNRTCLTFEKYFDGNVITSLKNTFEEISCNEIGGFLDIWVISNEGLKKQELKIDNIKVVDELEAYKNLNLVIADRLVGRIILGNKLIIESNSGVTQLDGDTITIKDNLGNLKLQAGKYTDPNNSSNFKYGLYIPNGSIDIRSTDTPNRGIQMDDNGYRAFNSNGVRTFDVNAQTGLVSIIGSLNIKTSEDTNRGVIFDGNGISAYNLQGSRTFYVDTNGNVTANNGNFTGIINATGGTISGDLTVTGTLTGGSFNSGSFNSGTFTSGIINGTVINAGEINGSTISGVNITSANINISEDVTIGSRLILQGSLSEIWFDSSINSINANGGNLNVVTLGILNLASPNVKLGLNSNSYIDFSFASALNATNIKVGSATKADTATNADKATDADNAENARNSLYVRGLYLAYNETFVYLRDQFGTDVAQLKRSDAP